MEVLSSINELRIGYFDNVTKILRRNGEDEFHLDENGYTLFSKKIKPHKQ
jgi:hypothetical protein